MHVLFGNWTEDDVAVLEVSDEQWRVADLRRRDADGMAVLGEIERDGETYRATALGGPTERAAFPDFGNAVRYLERFCLDN
jgi:hypothetical protein